ncbi:MAG TPA: LPXTG cell wall anchor domain-containing protein, partial [Micromonosporaceae bacterium]|nr:LPXTG cell wall anchor domain-containing protein [Micromonosporaceae bacterium]
MPDLRLYGFAAGTWAATVPVLHTGTAVGIWLAAAAAALAVASGLVLAKRRDGPASKPRRDMSRERRRAGQVRDRPPRSGRWWGLAALGVLLGLVTGAASAAARTSMRDADPLATLAR